jgi:BirA family biotin operon repressor/biotin-[acetyl-CoA-carboxylase] ligase
MTEAAEWLQAGAADFSLVLANEQTAGRGRFQRRWYTPPDAALAFSLILRPRESEEGQQSLLFTGLGAVAVCEALERLYGLRPQIKWPNDVLVTGKKVCGILSEAHWQGEKLLGIVLGIGINVAPSSVPPVSAVLFPATCVEDCLASSIYQAPVRVDRFQLLAGVLERI